MMKRKKLLTSILTLSCLLLMHVTAYAQEQFSDTNAEVVKDAREFVSDNIAKVVGSPRGMFISTVELTISDLGSGTVNLHGSVLCHEPMEEIKLNLYLDKWISANEDWSQINKFEFDWLAEDYPDEPLTMAIASVDVPGLERGIDYRLRGIAGAWDLDSTLYEVFRADTASILVE